MGTVKQAGIEQVAKRLYKNNTGGWLGVVTLDHEGKVTGVSIAPFGTIWLSDAEAILTARAPSDPKNNPFEEQEFIGRDANGASMPFKLRPLVLASDEARDVPSMERYVPGISEAEGRAMAMAGALAQEPGPITTEAAIASAQITDSAPVPPVASAVPVPAPPVPSVPPAPEEPEVSWTDPSPQTGQIVPGTLQGANEPAPDPSSLPPDPAAPAPAVPPQVVPTAPGGQPAATPPAVSAEQAQAGTAPGAPEETAAAVPEETGAALPPTAPPPEGEFAQAEEVGSPEAPTQGAPPSAPPPSAG